MSFDPFQARLDFLGLLRKLNASLPSIQKVVAFAVRFGSRCGEDLWECITEECSKGSLNTRINILYFLDSLADASLTLGPRDAPYLRLISRDLGTIVDGVVPDTREGVLNRKAAKQILDSWRTRRIIDPPIIDEVLAKLDERRGEAEPKKRTREESFSRNDILRRMEEDRERHKRLRERIWILPIPPLHSKRPHAPPGGVQQPSSSASSSVANPSPTASPFTPASPSHRTPNTPGKKGPKGDMGPPPAPASVAASAAGPAVAQIPAEKERIVTSETALEVEFEQMWETTSDLNADDLDKMREDAAILGRETVRAR